MAVANKSYFLILPIALLWIGAILSIDGLKCLVCKDCNDADPPKSTDCEELDGQTSYCSLRSRKYQNGTETISRRCNAYATPLNSTCSVYECPTGVLVEDISCSCYEDDCNGKTGQESVEELGVGRKGECRAKKE